MTGNVAREGSGETRPGTERAVEDHRQLRRVISHSAGGGAHRRPGAEPIGVPAVRPRAPLPARADGLPVLPAAFQVALDDGLDALGIPLSAAQRTVIEDHARLLLAWNAGINLTAITDPRGIAVLHVLDSLSAVVPIRASGARSLLDLGSGSGYPGIPLAAVLPLERVLLVESVAKKARFLQAVVDACGLADRVSVAALRAETLASQTGQRDAWDVVTARAVGSLGDLVELAFPLLVRGGLLVAWKRGKIDRELAGARRAIAALGGGTIERHPAGLDTLADHQLVIARRSGQVPGHYPRDPRVRQREPWEQAALLR